MNIIHWRFILLSHWNALLHVYRFPTIERTCLSLQIQNNSTKYIIGIVALFIDALHIRVWIRKQWREISGGFAREMCTDAKSFFFPPRRCRKKNYIQRDSLYKILLNRSSVRNVGNNHKSWQMVVTAIYQYQEWTNFYRICWCVRSLSE